MTVISGIAGAPNIPGLARERFSIFHDHMTGEFYIRDTSNYELPLQIPSHIIMSMNRPASQTEMEYLYGYLRQCGGGASLQVSGSPTITTSSSGLTMPDPYAERTARASTRDTLREEQYFRKQAAVRKAAVRRLKSCSEAFIYSMEQTIDSECEVAIRTARAYSD